MFWRVVYCGLRLGASGRAPVERWRPAVFFRGGHGLVDLLEAVVQGGALKRLENGAQSVHIQ